MKLCFGYVRVSTAKQGEGVSLEAQTDAISAYAERNNLTVSQWFQEKETAASTGRPVFASMLKALRKGDAQGLIIHKIDRSARNFADWAKIGELSDCGIDVHFVSESLDFRSRGGRLSADIQAVIAADYIRNLREETIKGIHGRLKQGLYPFGAPIGYLNNGGGKLKTPDPVRAPLILRTFELYASGQFSIRSLRKEMWQLGLRTAKGHMVSKGGVEKILNNPFYVGIIRIKTTGMTYVGAHVPLITQVLYDAAQDAKAGRTRKKTTKHLHTYRGLFSCANCNLAMIPERQKGHVYYRCHTQKCQTMCIREEKIEEVILEKLTVTGFVDGDVLELASMISNWIRECDAREETNVIPMQIAQHEAKLERLTDALIDQIIDNETFATRKETVLFEIARLRERQNKEAIPPDENDLQRFLELVKSLASNYAMANPVEKRELVQLTTSNRVVTGKNVCLERADWLQKADNSVAVLCGVLHRTKSRSRQEMSTSQIESLIECMKQDAVNTLMNSNSSKQRKNTVWQDSQRKYF